MGRLEKNPKKQKDKRLIIFLSSFLALLVVAVSAAVWVLVRYHLVEGNLYPKDAAVLDLREEEIDIPLYQKLTEKMPQAQILWNVPFQGSTLPHDIEEVTVQILSEEDVKTLALLKNLKTVHAEDCRDYSQLSTLRQLCPKTKVEYSVHFSGESYAWDVKELVLNSVAEADIQLLEHLGELKTVALLPGTYEQKTVEALKGAVHNLGLEFGVILSDSLYPDTLIQLTLENSTEEELALLPYLQNLETLHLVNPILEGDQLLAFTDSLPDVAVTWEVSLGDQTYGPDTTEVDLSMVEITDLAEAERKLNCLPNLETVIFGLCGIDNPEWENSRSKLTASPVKNEELAAYRDRVREKYKVIWTVRLGPSIALRTDADNFMPNHFGVGQLPDDYAYNLRYCEEMVCLDVGHMTLTDISFVEYMPNLKYLILAWTEVQYIEPIRTCKNLVFLELDHSCIRDLSPLVDCTALEDLNLGMTYCSIDPILEMTWLKNVYMILRGGGGLVGQAIPDARVITSADPDAATVGYGWRRLPNYYAMRDCLHAPYMN